MTDIQPTGAGGLEDRIVPRPVPLALARFDMRLLQEGTHQLQACLCHRGNASPHLLDVSPVLT
jgi:hypothetical protein